MPDQLFHWVLGLVILAHAIAQLGAIGALWWLGSGRAKDAGGWTVARSWAVPRLAPGTATGLGHRWSGRERALLIRLPGA